MKVIFYLMIIKSSFLLSQNEKFIEEIKMHQFEQNMYFKTKGKSPLTDSERKKFIQHDFFKIDLKYRVEAILKRTPNTSYFNMKTTTNRLSEERIFGTVSFILNGKKHILNVYQGKQLITKKGFEDYLFLPFLDDTNSETTYSGGRYLDLRIPNGNKIIIDFNKAYNPYCLYNKKYSCPIVPSENYIASKVMAGVKNYNN